ncbi:restriction endonuclease subunit S [Pseudoalteromonas sp. Isolate3]|uniref:restriction endonuclease subunit S n=1 Tax=Pseudoalteromonas sp. Isolate3 TaxID=2908526 RepID=UPI001EFCECBD|nr:restriction endonuclease subunit S [Pseudoalteromonas sp. Isolate3]MCG9707423.1 restriction endonuclease subunit S [Pseudoalteromonas sp. Isolate3]
MNTSWTELTLDDVCSKITDGAHHSPKSVENGKPMSSVKDMTPFGLNLKSSRVISEDDFNKLVKQGCKPEVNDVLISKDGNSALDTVCRVREPVDAVLLSSVAILRPDISVIEPEFLRLYLDAEPTRQYLKSTSISGAAIPRVILKDFKRAKIKLPLSLDKQRVLSSYISNYDNLIENNNRRIAILEDMAQSLYREWFVNFRYPNHEDNLDTDGNPKLVDSPLGQTPEGWEVKCLKGIGHINTGKTPSKKKEENYSSRDVPFIKTPDMHSGMFVINTKEMLSTVGADSQKTKYIPSWSICVSCIGTAGIVALSSQRSQTNQQINTLVPESNKYTEFMYFALKALKKTIENHGATGATMTNLSKSKFEALEVVLPDESILNEFHQLTNPMFKQIQALARKNENLKQQRDMLLPKLISGQIEL